jgi:predicted ABC-type ATPase
MMLSEIRSFAKRRVSFAFETTLSGRSHLVLLRQLKTKGYKIHVFLLWVNTVDLALSRVQERVSRGGHDVPEPIVRRRFDRSIRNFLSDYRRLADTWILFDNSHREPAVIAAEEGQGVGIMNKDLYSLLVKHYGRI